MLIFDENNKLVNTAKIECKEQNLAKAYVKTDDTVLELGARYGSVSCIVNNILNIKTNHVVVEPDDTVWSVLSYNKKNNNSHFHIVEGIIGNKSLSLIKDGYATRCSSNTVDNTIKYFSLQDIKTKYSINYFTVLIADCEGCLPDFLKENKEILHSLRLVIFETDNKQSVNYNDIHQMMSDYNFNCVKSFRNHFVYQK
jgi:FkbM family methyltransferase